MSESSRKTPSPLIYLVFAMLIAYAGCSSTAPTVTTTPANTTTTATVSSSPSASSSPATTSNSTSPQTTNLTSPASASTPTTGSTATQATSPTSSPVTVTTAQSSSTLPSTGTPAVHDSTSTSMTTGQSTSSLSSSNVTTAGGVTNPSGQTATSTSQSSQPPDSTLTHESSTAAVTSNNTEAPTTAAPATPEPTTTPATTPAPTTPAPTTVAPPPNSQTVNPDASFLLTIDVGPDKNVSCTDCNSSYVVEAFKAAFQSIPGFLYIDNVVTSAPTFRVNIRFFGSQFRTLNTTERQQSIWDALVNINNTEGLFVLDSARKIAEAFALTSDSLCNTERACSLGFRCTSARCVHMCEGYSCGDHGTCSLTISPDGEASPTCICNSDDETTYSGEYCQDSKISQRKVAAIVGGVLGAFCGLFIIIIIIMCCRQRESSSTKYQLGGTANQGYSSMGMKEL